jgi:hypothetical protein
MWSFTTAEAMIFCTTILTAIGVIVTALKTHTVHIQQRVIEGKLDTVHSATNSRLSRLDQELAATREELSKALEATARAEQESEDKDRPP